MVLSLLKFFLAFDKYHLRWPMDHVRPLGRSQAVWSGDMKFMIVLYKQCQQQKSIGNKKSMLETVTRNWKRKA